MKFVRKHIYLFLLSLLCVYCYPQKAVPFNIRYQSKVKGDIIVIANNITNRINENQSNTSFINRRNSPSDNQDFQMGYIDIDNDSSTFSSSSANLNLENPTNKKIIYAGLYWSATYKYKKGIKNEKNDFVPEDATRDSINQVKIKLPNQEKYIDIKGQIIYDGVNQKKYKQDAPYVVYANITNEILNLNNPFGNYTVANVRATNGVLENGVASGWTIFFVYEDIQMSEKWIVSKDGFIPIGKKETILTFSKSEIKSNENINAKIVIAALEGDKNQIGDELYFKKANKNKYVPFENVLRPKDNIFNSTITIANDYLPNRNPDSNNTFGYDTFLASVPNKENEIISTDSKPIKVKLKSKNDNLYLFFTAFSIEIEKVKEIPKTNQANEIANSTENVNVSNNNSTPKLDGFISMNIVSSNNEKVKANANKENNNSKIQSLDSNENTKGEEVNSTNEEGKEQVILKNQNSIADVYTNYDIEGIEKGYYLIVNVFAKQSNQINFVKYLNNKGFKASFFYNPQKKYYYVYIESSNNISEIEALRNSKINNKYQEDMWILAVNNPLSTESYAKNTKTYNKENVLYKINTDLKQVTYNNNKKPSYSTSFNVLTSLLSSFYIVKDQPNKKISNFRYDKMKYS